MTQYRLKNSTTEAVQWLSGVVIPGALETPDNSVYLHTPNGKRKLALGDYVLSDNRVLSAVEFEALYELVVEKEVAESARERKNRLAREARAAKQK